MPAPASSLPRQRPDLLRCRLSGQWGSAYELQVIARHALGHEVIHDRLGTGLGKVLVRLTVTGVVGVASNLPRRVGGRHDRHSGVGPAPGARVRARERAT